MKGYYESPALYLRRVMWISCVIILIAAGCAGRSLDVLSKRTGLSLLEGDSINEECREYFAKSQLPYSVGRLCIAYQDDILAEAMARYVDMAQEAGYTVTSFETSQPWSKFPGVQFKRGIDGLTITYFDRQRSELSRQQQDLFDFALSCEIKKRDSNTNRPCSKEVQGRSIELGSKVNKHHDRITSGEKRPPLLLIYTPEPFGRYRALVGEF